MKFLTIEELIEKMEELKEEGFDRIHLPGGSSWDNSFCASTIVFVYDPDTKDVYFAGIPYNSNYMNSNGNNKKQGETPEETAIREVLEECGVHGFKSDLLSLSKSNYSVSDINDPERRHFKYYFLLQIFSGEFFSFEGPNPIDQGVAAPLLIPSRLFKEVLFKKHLPAFQEAVEFIMAKDMDHCYALMNLFPRKS